MVTVYFRIIDNTGSEYFGNIECQNWENQIKRIMNVYGLKDEKQVNILDVVNKY